MHRSPYRTQALETHGDARENLHPNAEQMGAGWPHDRRSTGGVALTGTRCPVVARPAPGGVLPVRVSRALHPARGNARRIPSVAGVAALSELRINSADYPVGLGGSHQRQAVRVLDPEQYGRVRTKGKPAKFSLDLWFHLTLDALWILNGIIFFVMLFATGQWARVGPTSWDVFPNALSALLQYASLDWPLENGWNNYNSLQLLSYFTTIFIAAPLAILTGLRMSGAWPENATGLNRAYPIAAARAFRFPVMIYFAAFIIVHVTLVLATGGGAEPEPHVRRQRRRRMTGLWVFAASLAVMVGAWGLARPLFLRPVASLMGKVNR